MALKDHIDTDFLPTRKVLAGAIAAAVLPLIAQLAAQFAWLAWLAAPSVAEAIPVFAFFLAAYFVRDEAKRPTPEFQGENVTSRPVPPPGRTKGIHSSPLAAILGLVVLTMFMTACATDPGVRWAQSQTGYNDTVRTIIAMRRPCVPGAGVENAGPDHPQCRVDDALYDRFEAIRLTADQTLRLIDDAGRTNQTERLARYLIEFEGYLAELVAVKVAAETAGADEPGG